MPKLSLPIRQRGALIKILVRTPESDAPDRPETILGPYSAYLDTGASDTVLDSGVVDATKLEPIQMVSLNVLGRDVESYHQTFTVEMAVVASGAEPMWIPLTVLSGPIHPRGTVAALGRDFLRYFQLSYSGPDECFTLDW